MGTEHLTGRKCIMAATRPPQVPGVIHNNHATEFQQKKTIPQLQFHLKSAIVGEIKNLNFKVAICQVKTKHMTRKTLFPAKYIFKSSKVCMLSQKTARRRRRQGSSQGSWCTFYLSCSSPSLTSKTRPPLWHSSHLQKLSHQDCHCMGLFHLGPWRIELRRYFKNFLKNFFNGLFKYFQVRVTFFSRTLTLNCFQFDRKKKWYSNKNSFF